MAETILVVDDEAQIRTTLRGVLSDEGFDVVEAENGRAALEVLAHQAPRLAIVDIWMPEVDGIELVQRMRTQAPGVPIIVISGPRHDRDGRARDPRRARSTSWRSRSSSMRCCAWSAARSTSARRRGPPRRPRRAAAASRARAARRLPQRTIATQRRRERAGAALRRAHRAHPAAAAARQRDRVREHHQRRDGAGAGRPRRLDRLRDDARARRHGRQDGRAPDGGAARATASRTCS